MPLVSTLTVGALLCQSVLRALPMYDFLIQAAKGITKIYDKKQIFDKNFTFKYVAEKLSNQQDKIQYYLDFMTTGTTEVT